MDTLSTVLDSLHFKGSFYFTTNFKAPWGVQVPQYKKVARFHYVSTGACWVRVEGVQEPQRLLSGDLIVIPHGSSHILSDTPDRAPMSLDDAYSHAGYDGEGTFHLGDGIPQHGTQLVCGHFEFSELFNHPLISHLPAFVLQKESNGTELSWVRDTLKFLSHTAGTRHDGSSAIIKRLSEVIFIQAIRFWSKTDNEEKGFIAALNDKHLASGLKMFHANFSDEWTVEKLAKESNMSRSSFANRFKQYLDMSPMQYVTQWRMQSAQQMLIESDLPLESIALSVGYESGAAFSKAFKRIIGASPGEFRKASIQQEQLVDTD